MTNYFNYQRISTQEERNKQSFARQSSAMERYAKENNIEWLIEFKEDKSGKNFNDRKEWQKLEKLLQAGDTLVIKDISRFSREAEAGYNKYMELMNKGIEIIFLDNPTVSTPYIKELTKVAEQQDLIARTTLENTIKLLLLVELDRAEKERELIVKRIKQGIEASDKKAGRKTGALDKMTDELKADIKEYLNNREIKQVDIMNKHNIKTYNTFRKYVEIVKNEE